jgi:hypothetical protein
MRWKLFLGMIFVLFIGIMASVWYIAEKTNPVMLDERGQPLNSPASNE